MSAVASMGDDTALRFFNVNCNGWRRAVEFALIYINRRQSAFRADI